MIRRCEWEVGGEWGIKDEEGGEANLRILGCVIGVYGYGIWNLDPASMVGFSWGRQAGVRDGCNVDWVRVQRWIEGGLGGGVGETFVGRSRVRNDRTAAQRTDGGSHCIVARLVLI